MNGSTISPFPSPGVKTDDPSTDDRATRFIAEVNPSLLDLKKVVDALDVLGRVRLMPDLTDAADKALADLAEQLRAADEEPPG